MWQVVLLLAKEFTSPVLRICPYLFFKTKGWSLRVKVYWVSENRKVNVEKCVTFENMKWKLHTYILQNNNTYMSPIYCHYWTNKFWFLYWPISSETNFSLKFFNSILGKLSKIKTTKHMEFSICWLKKIKVSKNAQNGFLCI